MKRIILLFMLLTLAVFGNISEIHQKALSMYKEGKVSEAIDLLEENGIKEKDTFKDISDKNTAMILNDYGYFLSKKIGRETEAIEILEKVIEISPDRIPVYLNIGDIYFEEYKKNKNKEKKGEIDKYYRNYISLLKVKDEIPSRVYKFFRDETFNEVLEEIREKEKTHAYFYNKKEYGIEFFKTFIEDFRKQNNIGYIEPIIETDDMSNGELINLLKGDFNLEELTTWIEKIRVGIDEDGNDVFDSSSDVKHRRMFRFKIYNLDLKNKEKYIFYSSGNLSEWDEDYINKLNSNQIDDELNRDSSYMILDFKDKKVINQREVTSEFDYFSKLSTKNLNGIFKYENIYFIYEIYKGKKAIYINLYSINGKSIANFRFK